MMSAQAQNDVATASDRKDAVRKAFNQEYMATQKAMSQAAERARAQVLDQRQAIATHAGNVKTGTQPPQPSIGSQAAGYTDTQPKQDSHQGAPNMTPHSHLHDDQQVMFEIANEIRKIIAQEIDLRMQALATQVETALAEAFPPSETDKDQSSGSNTPSGQKSASAKKT